VRLPSHTLLSEKLPPRVPASPFGRGCVFFFRSSRKRTGMHRKTARPTTAVSDSTTCWKDRSLLPLVAGAECAPPPTRTP
jgi:hypothetical protein